jgi:NAD(P)H-hydrate epimerase
VTYCLPERAFAKFDARYPEVMCDAIPDDGTAAFAPAGMDAALKSTVGKSAVVIGPAIGTEPQTRIFTNDFVRRSDAPLIIDADGLNNLDIASLSTRKKLTILTPHPGEMAKLVGKTISEIQSDRLKYATQLARSARVIVVLKGRGTIVAMPDGKSAINTTGNAGMATAGMGDALTGIMAAFIAEGMQASDAAIAAVFIHGLAGDMAASELGERSLITSDVIRKIPHAIKSVESEPLSLRGAK